jgi:hypothetical protein
MFGFDCFFVYLDTLCRTLYSTMNYFLVDLTAYRRLRRNEGFHRV